MRVIPSPIVVVYLLHPSTLAFKRVIALPRAYFRKCSFFKPCFESSVAGELKAATNSRAEDNKSLWEELLVLQAALQDTVVVVLVTQPICKGRADTAEGCGHSSASQTPQCTHGDLCTFNTPHKRTQV